MSNSRASLALSVQTSSSKSDDHTYALTPVLRWQQLQEQLFTCAVAHARSGSSSRAGAGSTTC
jgi:hypothetical protein